MLSKSRAPFAKTIRLARVPLVAWLLVASVASYGQAAPAVSTIVAFNGSVPNARLVQGADGALYGSSAANSPVTGGIIFRATTNGSSVTTVHQLVGSEGSSPRGGLLLGSDGLLYGSTTYGASTERFSSGTTYRVAIDGSQFAILHRFAEWSSTNITSSPVSPDDGVYPDGVLMEGSDGYLYGVTRAGGDNGTGVVFRQSRDGTSFSVLHEFAAITSSASDSVVKNADGATPAGTLIQAPDGFIYGTATVGGRWGRGTIFRLHMDGTGFEVVHEFTDLSSGSPAINVDGATPVAGLTDGQDGLLYGVASAGGANGVGTLFSLDPASTLLTPLHDFDSTNGAAPTGAVIVGQDLKLYGTTSRGGTSASGAATTLGTIYSIARDGTGFAKLHSFDGTNGSNPAGPLLQLNASTFVGAAPGGGKCGQGTLYSFSTTGATVTGNTTCGQKKKNQSGGGATDPLIVLGIAALGLARRRRRD